jgi:hypothetical protein
MTAVLSLYAGPGAGKSTSAAYLYAKLKAEGKRVEMVREYIKDWVWEGRIPTTYDQFYILGKQIRRESSLLGKVDIIITDSPVWLCGYYSNEISPPLIKSGVESCIQGYYQQAKVDGHRHIHIWVTRPKTFDAEGRWHTEEQSKHIDSDLRPYLTNRGMDLEEVTADFNSLDEFVKDMSHMSL